jgi:hypothetical protein
MNSDRIKEIQETTAYPESVSVKQALLQVWNECAQEQGKNCSIPAVINRRELFVAFLREYHTSMLVFAEMPDIETIVDDYLKSN